VPQLFRASALYSSVRMMIIGFGKLFTAREEGERIIRAAIKGAGMIVEGFEVSSDVAKVLRFAGKIASFLSILGVLIDSVSSHPFILKKYIYT
jgi:hypothetical protein